MHRIIDKTTGVEAIKEDVDLLNWNHDKTKVLEEPDDPSSEENRRKRALRWYNSLAEPTLETMRKCVDETKGMDVSKDDLDLLNWNKNKTKVLPDGESDAEALNDAEMRRREAMNWYKRLASPTRETMRRVHDQTSGMNIEKDDIDSLRWNHDKTKVIEDDIGLSNHSQSSMRSTSSRAENDRNRLEEARRRMEEGVRREAERQEKEVDRRRLEERKIQDDIDRRRRDADHKAKLENDRTERAIQDNSKNETVRRAKEVDELRRHEKGGLETPEAREAKSEEAEVTKTDELVEAKAPDSECPVKDEENRRLRDVLGMNRNESARLKQNNAPGLPAANNRANFNTKESGRSQRARKDETEDQKQERILHIYAWWARLGQPTRSDFKRRMKTVTPADMVPDDVDSLPWSFDGSTVMVNRINKLVNANQVV
jgi:hypothetical protein